MESAYLLRVIYYSVYFNRERDDKDINREIFRTVLYRPEENLLPYTIYYKNMQDYKAFEHRQCFNISFKEYMELTTLEKIEMDRFAKDWAEQMSKAMQNTDTANQKKDLDRQMKKYKKDLKNAVGGYGLDSLSEMSDGFGL